MASKEPKVALPDPVAQSIRDIIQQWQVSLVAFSEALPIVRRRLRGTVPQGDIRNLAVIAEDLVNDEREHIAAFGWRIMDWIEDGAPPYLDTYLGLRQQGGKSPGHALALDRRDRALRSVRGEEWGDCNPTEAAKRMIQSLERYQSNQWGRDQKAGRAPVAQPEATWWQLLQEEHRMPGERQLKAILQGRS
jgi:hypothetical protein